jgi:hypothetical protein
VEEYSQEEITNLNEIDQVLNTHNQYATAATTTNVAAEAATAI